MNKYYIAIDGSQQGPFSLDELKEKKISNTSLVWAETMKDWDEAANVDELKDIIKTTPPPIPIKQEKPIKVEAEISKKKKKDKLISAETKVAIAKEIKTNFKMVLYALIIGIISYIIIFGINDGFGHRDMADKWDRYWKTNSPYETRAAREKLESESGKLEYYGESKWGTESRCFFHAAEYHESRYKEEAEDAIWPSILTAIIASIVLIAGRYIVKGAKWVENTSKKV